MIPTLPVAPIRAAIDAGQWTQAAGLLDQHRQALVVALAESDLVQGPTAPWRELLLAQHALQDELRTARDRVAQELEKLGHDHRRARAWLRELA